MRFIDLLSPVLLDSFIDKYWSKDYLYLEGNENRYQSLFSWKDYNALINNTVCNQSMRLVKHGETLINNKIVKSPMRFDRGFIEKCRENKCTIVLDKTELYHNGLKKLCKDFHRLFKEPVQINTYCSFANVQGFSVHQDPQDVFIFQIEGEKEWKLYGFATEEPSEPLRTITLKKGDFLYLPRGYWHAALAKKDHPSLHHTFTVTRHRISELYSWIFDELTDTDDVQDTNRNLPQIINDKGEIDYDYSSIHQQLTTFLEKVNSMGEEGLKGLIQQTKASIEVNVNNFNDFEIENDIIYSIDNISSDAKLIKAFHQHFIKRENDLIKIYALGHELELPADAKDLINVLFSNEECKVKEIFEATEEFHEDDIKEIIMQLIDHQLFLLSTLSNMNYSGHCIKISSNWL